MLNYANHCMRLASLGAPLRSAQFYLYFDDDAAGRQAVEKFSKLLGVDRVRVVR